MVRPASLRLEDGAPFDIRSPTAAVSRTPLPLTPATGSSVRTTHRPVSAAPDNTPPFQVPDCLPPPSSTLCPVPSACGGAACLFCPACPEQSCSSWAPGGGAALTSVRPAACKHRLGEELAMRNSMKEEGCSSGLQVSSPTLAILRTPMPFGSPVPYPAPDADPARAPDQAPAAQRPRGGADNAPAQPAQFAQLPYTMPYELR